MLLENKKNKSRNSITDQEWQTLKDVGFAKNFSIISREDQKYIPKAIVELKKFTK